MKYALVTPLLKKRCLNVNVLTNYRPISQISLVSTTLERHVANELHGHIDTNDYNDPFQSAYRPRHRTKTALACIHEDLTQAIDARRGVLFVLLDLSAAFDTPDHTILLQGLCNIGLSYTLITLFTSYLGGRMNAVKTSARRTTQHGVPHGSLLGPILFNLYSLSIADIFKCHNLRYHMYADNTQLYAKCPPSQHKRCTSMH